MARITTQGIFKGRSLSAGDSATSDPIDLRYSANKGFFSLSAAAISGTAGTVGTTVYTYSGCSTIDGKYITPCSAVAIGTNGTACTSSFFTFEPELIPFLKIIATQTGTGTAGYDSIITAELNVQ